jgi:hypothetical protein
VEFAIRYKKKTEIEDEEEEGLKEEEREKWDTVRTEPFLRVQMK